MTLCGDGLAVHADLVRAADAATDQALAALGGVEPDLAFVFACGPEPDDVAGALVRAAKATGARRTVGCSAGGVIGGGRAVELTSAVSVWVGSLPGARLRGFHLEVLPADDDVAIVGLPPAHDSDRSAVLLADPYSFPTDAFLGHLGFRARHLPLSGGLANGLRGAGSTRLLLDGVVHERGAVGVVLGDGVSTGTVVSQGCRPIGPVMTVTAASGNRLLALAGRRAVDKLEEVVAGLEPGDQALVTTGLHLGVAMDEYADQHDGGDFLLRSVLGADPAEGSLLAGCEVAVGQTVQFQVRDAETAGADLALRLDDFRLGLSAGEAVGGALLFSCTGRGADLFASADHDVRAVGEALGSGDGSGGPPVAGFFSAGEIGPVGGRNHLHAYTASVLAFR